MLLIESSFVCDGCGKRNYIAVDPCGGAEQTYIEDCQYCCKANTLWIRADAEAGAAEVIAQLEYE